MRRQQLTQQNHAGCTLPAATPAFRCCDWLVLLLVLHGSESLPMCVNELDMQPHPFDHCGVLDISQKSKWESELQSL
jgi:hypothetical protein